MSEKEKIGIAVITKDRENYLKQCLESIDPLSIDEIVIVNDGADLSDEIKKILLKFRHKEYILNEKNLGVAKTKNKALKHLLEKDCEHIFVLEDDCIVLSNQIWSKYINASKATNILHFNYGPGSPWNRKQEDPSIIGDLSKRHLAKQTTNPNPKLIVQYDKQLSLALYEHIVAMFVYFRREVLEKVGLLDERFFNAWEHVSHTYDIIKAGYYTPFWWFADLADSHLFLAEAKDEKANTSLAKSEKQFMEQVHEGLKIFNSLHGLVPSQIPCLSKNEVIKTIKQIKQHDN